MNLRTYVQVRITDGHGHQRWGRDGRKEIPSKQKRAKELG